MKIPVIKTKKLAPHPAVSRSGVGFTLRPYKRGDEKSLARNINNKKIYRNLLRVPYPYKLKDAKEWVNQNLKWNKMKKAPEMHFVIDIDGEVAGAIGFDHIKGHHASIGYWLAEKYWGQGIVTQAAKIATKYGFDKLKLVRIYACVYPWNKASMRVLEKCGYKLEGILRKHIKKGNRFIDDYLYAKVK